MNARRLLAFLVFAVVGIIAAFAPASAHSSDGTKTIFFHDTTVEHGETINGDLNVIFGNATIRGTVTGNVNVVGGACKTADGGTVEGESHCVTSDAVGTVAPWIATAAAPGFDDESRKLYVKLGSSLVVVVVFLLFPLRMRLALDRVERHPGLSAAVGTGAIVAILPIALLLLISIVGIPLIVLEIAALFAGVWIGTGAVALLVGRRLWELAMPRTTPAPLAALILGLVVVSAAEIVPVVGWAVTALVWLIGLGATILAFIRPNAWTSFAQRPTIGGPPMNRPA